MIIDDDDDGDDDGDGDGDDDQPWLAGDDYFDDSDDIFLWGVLGN
jgi:hypothetical protein